jgi:hypothetical protein
VKNDSLESTANCLSETVSSVSVTWQKTKQKNTPVSRITLRVADARRGTMGSKKPDIQKSLFKLFQEGDLRSPALWEEPHS